jgi:hypothetical protein
MCNLRIALKKPFPFPSVIFIVNVITQSASANQGLVCYCPAMGRRHILYRDGSCHMSKEEMHRISLGLQPHVQGKTSVKIMLASFF